MAGKSFLRLVRARVLMRAAACVALAGIFLSAADAAQEGDKSPTPPSPARVADNILGVKIGMSLEEVHAKLSPLGEIGGRATRDGGRKEAVTLKGTQYTSVAYQTDGKGRVKWVTAFVRPGKEIPYTDIGDLARATRQSEQEAVWNVERPEGNFRVMAKGFQGKATVVHLLSLALPPMQ